MVIVRQSNLARESLKKGDKDRAKFYLRSKKHQETVITKTYEQLDNLENLIGTIEFKLIEKDVLYGLQQGNQVLSKLNNEMNIDKIDKILDDLEDERLKVDEVSDMLGTTNGLSNGEEMEVDEEFEKLDREVNGIAELPDAPKQEILPDVPKQEILPDAPKQEIVTDSKEEDEEEETQPQVLAA